MVIGATSTKLWPKQRSGREWKLKRKSGFTVIEVLITISIFTVAILGVAMSAASLMKAGGTSLYTTVATNLAQGRMEELKSRLVSALPVCPTYTTAGCSDTVTSGGLAFTRRWQVIVDSPVPGVNRIDVQIEWNNYNATHTVTLSGGMIQ